MINQACIVESITAVTTENQPISIDGQPSSFVDVNTKNLHFQSPNILSYVPSDVFRYFPNLESISLIKVQLSNLVSNAFRNCNNLKSIFAEGNNIQNVPSSFAAGCTNVQIIEAPNNNIQTIHRDTLKGLTSLKYVNFNHNQISCIPPTILVHTPFIENIFGQHNIITAMDTQLSRNLPHLKSIDLTHNQIPFLGNFDFTGTGLVHNSSIVLDDNPIAAIHPSVITNIFTSRAADMPGLYIGLHNNINDAIPSCVPYSDVYKGIDNENWEFIDSALSNCYYSWTPEMENLVVPCV